MTTLTAFPGDPQKAPVVGSPLQWLLNFTTRTKLILGFGVMILFLLVVGITAYFGSASLRNSLHTLYEDQFTLALELRTLRSNQNAIRASLLLLLFEETAAEQERWLQEIQERSEANNQLMRRLLDRAHLHPAMLSSLEELSSLQAAFQQTKNAQILPLIEAGNMDEVRALILGVQEDLNEQMRVLADQLISDVEQQAEDALVEAQQQADTNNRIFLITGVIALLSSVVLTRLLGKSIADPLKDMSVVADRITAGDLTVNVPNYQRTDEVGSLAQVLRRMIAALSEVNKEVHEGVNVLTGSTGEIVAATTQLTAGIAETATSVSETTTTVEEVRQVAEVSTQKAKHVLDSAQKSVQIAQSGRKSVDDTILMMQRIQGQMELVAESIVRLSEQSQAIGEIIATVTDLAEQSNLLAVNAAIEAAKAGEQGRGFAVVAQEVRSLAEQSKQATGQIRAILNDVQKATSGAVMATEQGGKAVEAGVKQSSEAGEAIRLLADMITEAAQAATQIAASSQQQLVGMSQVAQAMENINQAGAQNAASMRQTEEIAQNLHGLGQRLKQLVAHYNV